MTLCPSGHESASDDYCDVCGLPIPAGGAAPAAASAGSAAPVAPATPAASSPASPAAPAAPEETGECPNCKAANPPNALFCEACGYDFTTGSLPRPVSPPSVESVLDLGSGTEPPSVAPALDDRWVAEVWIDPDWYADQDSDDPLPSAGVPVVVPLKASSVLVGRTSRSRGIHPDIDLGTDNGISRRHCQLTTDGKRWWVEDLGSSNGTYVGPAVGALPTDPLDPGEKHEISDDERIYLGAWTRIVIRRATPGEI